MQESEGAATLTVPHQTWLCSFACHRDRSPSSRWRRTRERENEAHSQAQGGKSPKCQTRVKRSEKNEQLKRGTKIPFFSRFLSLLTAARLCLGGFIHRHARPFSSLLCICLTVADLPGHRPKTGSRIQSTGRIRPAVR